MPRTTRAVAQRLGTKQKSRRRPLRPTTELPASVERILDDAAPRLDDDAADGDAPAEPTRPARLAQRRGAGVTTRPAARPAPPRRRYAEYAAEYAYVSLDLRRIAVVTAVLLVLLVALSFVIG